MWMKISVDYSRIPPKKKSHTPSVNAEKRLRTRWSRRRVQKAREWCNRFLGLTELSRELTWWKKCVVCGKWAPEKDHKKRGYRTLVHDLSSKTPVQSPVHSGTPLLFPPKLPCLLGHVKLSPLSSGCHWRCAWDPLSTFFLHFQRVTPLYYAQYEEQNIMSINTPSVWMSNQINNSWI